MRRGRGRHGRQAACHTECHNDDHNDDVIGAGSQQGREAVADSAGGHGWLPAVGGGRLVLGLQGGVWLVVRTFGVPEDHVCDAHCRVAAPAPPSVRPLLHPGHCRAPGGARARCGLEDHQLHEDYVKAIYTTYNSSNHENIKFINFKNIFRV